MVVRAGGGGLIRSEVTLSLRQRRSGPSLGRSLGQRESERERERERERGRERKQASERESARARDRERERGPASGTQSGTGVRRGGAGGRVWGWGGASGGREGGWVIRMVCGLRGVREREYTCNRSYVCQVFPGGLVCLAREVQGSLANTDTHRPFDRPSPLGSGLPWGNIERETFNTTNMTVA